MPVTTEVRVRYAETDQMGIVYYANYLIWFEIGRVELLRSLGLAYSQLETDHQCILPVVEANCRYKSPARYDDRIAIETRPSLLRGSVVKFAYSLYRLPVEPGKERKQDRGNGVQKNLGRGCGRGAAVLFFRFPDGSDWLAGLACVSVHGPFFLLDLLAAEAPHTGDFGSKRLHSANNSE